VADALVRGESLVEYFKEMVESAASRQRVAVEPTTSHYVVRLLTTSADARAGTPPWLGAEPFARRLGEALETGGSSQRARLREIGDASLVLVGFFGDSLHRKIVDADYYVSLGEYAYGSLGQSDEETLASVFADLAARFGVYVDVLHEVSQRSALSSDRDLLKLYERWLHTGSALCARLLVERGIQPVAGSRRIQ
jgi:hypothetical protein